MFLADHTILTLVNQKVLVIDPFDDRRLQPCSYDVTLGAVDMPKPVDFEATVWAIQPGQFLLAATAERIVLPAHIAASVEGKSTWGRKGLAVHITAGHVDPGWDGDLTLEMFNHSQEPILLHKGVAIAQLVFTYLDRPSDRPYAGRYQGSRGVVQPRPSIVAQQGLESE